MSLSLQNDALTRLKASPLFQSDVRVAVHEQVARELSDHSLQWRRGAPDAAMHKAYAEGLHVYVLQYGAEVQVRPQPFADFTLVHTSLVGGIEIESDGHRFCIAEGRSAVISPRRDVRLHWHRGTVQLILRIPHSLVRQVAGLDAEEPLGLGPGTVIAPEHTALWNLQAESLLSTHSVAQNSPMRAAWLAHFERSIVMFLLAQSQGNDVVAGNSCPIRAAATGSSTSRMDAVMTYMDSHMAAPISLEDLARAGGVSVRTLHTLCQEFHGMPPMALLRHHRLDAARSFLMLNPTANIADTALDVGFGHIGRFAAYYKSAFGELPHETQARIRAQYS